MLLICSFVFVTLLMAVMVVIFSFPYAYESGYAGVSCPNETACNDVPFMAGIDENSTIHHYIFKASTGDKIWRGFILGCAIGLFVAALFCCWAPCLRFGPRGAVVRVWRYPRRAVTDAEGQRDGSGWPQVEEAAQGAAQERGVLSARRSPPTGRFVDRATLVSVRGSG